MTWRFAGPLVLLIVVVGAGCPSLPSTPRGRDAGGSAGKLEAGIIPQDGPDGAGGLADSSPAGAGGTAGLTPTSDAEVDGAADSVEDLDGSADSVEVSDARDLGGNDSPGPDAAPEAPLDGRGGDSGAGGAMAVCSASATRCSNGDLQTCSNGQWGGATPCGPHQGCSGPEGTAKCGCKTDPVCVSETVGNTCGMSAAVLVVCTQDQTGCRYQTSSSPCTSGPCVGAAGAALCCQTNCSSGAKQCAGASVQTCGASTNGCLAFGAAVVCPTGNVCERYGSPSCVDPNWAEWPITNSAVEVADGAPNLASFTDNQDLTITDNVTALMWQKGTSPGTLSQADASLYCANLLLATHHDWRLPSLIELVSIVDFGKRNPSTDVTFFPTPAMPFWSSTADQQSAWSVDFSTGIKMGRAALTVLSYARCVR